PLRWLYGRTGTTAPVSRIPRGTGYAANRPRTAGCLNAAAAARTLATTATGGHPATGDAAAGSRGAPYRLSGAAERKPAGTYPITETLRCLQLGGRLHCPDPTTTGRTAEHQQPLPSAYPAGAGGRTASRSEEHTSVLQSRENIVCRLLLE